MLKSKNNMNNLFRGLAALSTDIKKFCQQHPEWLCEASRVLNFFNGMPLVEVNFLHWATVSNSQPKPHLSFTLLASFRNPSLQSLVVKEK